MVKIWIVPTSPLLIRKYKNKRIELPMYLINEASINIPDK